MSDEVPTLRELLAGVPRMCAFCGADYDLIECDDPAFWLACRDKAACLSRPRGTAM